MPNCFRMTLELFSIVFKYFRTLSETKFGMDCNPSLLGESISRQAIYCRSTGGHANTTHLQTLSAIGWWIGVLTWRRWIWNGRWRHCAIPSASKSIATVVSSTPQALRHLLHTRSNPGQGALKDWDIKACIFTPAPQHSRLSWLP